MKLERAIRMPLSQVVLDQLLGQIRSGVIKPGDRLPGEYELMRMLGVGRSSVREAMRGLVALGLVETRPGRGAVVTAPAGVPVAHLGSGPDSVDRLQKWAILELLEVRESLEGQAARLAAERATAADLAVIRARARDVEAEIASGRTYFRSNAEFHLAIARASHNSMLAESVRHLIGQVRAYRERLMREIQGMPGADIREHRAVVEAIAGHQPGLAQRAMIRHIRHFAALVRALDVPGEGTRAGAARRVRGR